MAVAITRTDDPVGVSASSNVAIYTSASIGTASADRVVVLCVGIEIASPAISSATIDYGSGDVAMNALAGNSLLGSNMTRLFWLLVPSGTTATFKVNFGAINPTNVQNHISVYAVTGAYPVVSGGSYVSTDMDSTAPLYAVFSTVGGTPAGAAFTIIPTNGGLLACASCATDTVAKTWAGATEDLDEDAGDFRWTTATSVTGANAAVTCTGGTNGEDGALAFALFYPNNGAFGDLKAIGGRQTSASITNPLSPHSPISLSVGDLVVVSYTETTSNTATGVTDSLGHTGLPLTSSATNKSYYYIVTTPGVATISVATTAGAVNSAALAVTVYAGPFAVSPLDKNPAILSDSAGPYTSNLSGTLSQADELVVGTFSQTTGGQISLGTPNPGKIDVQIPPTAGGAAVHTSITSTVVAATTSLTMALAASGTTATGCGIATFKKGVADVRNNSALSVLQAVKRGSYF